MAEKSQYQNELLLKRLIASQGEAKKLRDAIEKHRAQTGHNMCWENDEELWSVLGDSVSFDHTKPDRKEFLKRCEQYCDSRKGD